MDAQAGDLIQVETKNGREKGILMPGSEEGVLIIKLGNGYNLGFKKEEIKKIKVLERKEIKKANAKPEVEKGKPPSLPIISLLHCGGTIASKIDYATGAVSANVPIEDDSPLFLYSSKTQLLRKKVNDGKMFFIFGYRKP